MSRQLRGCLRGTDGPGVRLGEGQAQDLSRSGKWALGSPDLSQQMVLYPTGAGEPRRLERGGLRLRLREVLPDGKRVSRADTKRDFRPLLSQSSRAALRGR